MSSCSDQALSLAAPLFDPCQPITARPHGRFYRHQFFFRSLSQSAPATSTPTPTFSLPPPRHFLPSPRLLLHSLTISRCHTCRLSPQLRRPLGRRWTHPYHRPRLKIVLPPEPPEPTASAAVRSSRTIPPHQPTLTPPKLPPKPNFLAVGTVPGSLRRSYGRHRCDSRTPSITCRASPQSLSPDSRSHRRRICRSRRIGTPIRF
ncbi:hypothetical protein BO99DRAFT_106529 [Aspergillus violaceofuscus CBS 115571]|uniref:Uncharacterized protein n=1 Tax=Aspergillus violaceofuscus (strain CBS 115571) TaxID=1450538 RepID=A0A2V5HAU8_ASPV1|nr:hypothetical protein BO99DRAFT_106529 [Aspergillus violaceofuscus CBS 115571]